MNNGNNMDSIKAVDFKLINPIKVSTGSGDYVECDTVTLFAPTANNRKEVASIKGFIGPLFRAMGDMATDEERAAAKRRKEERDAQKSTGEIVDDGDDGMLTGADFAVSATTFDIDVDKQGRALDAFASIVTTGGRSRVIDKPLTQTLFDKLDYHDMENMFYQYGISFLLDSLLS